MFIVACLWTRCRIKWVPVATFTHVTDVTCDHVCLQVWHSTAQFRTRCWRCWCYTSWDETVLQISLKHLSILLQNVPASVHVHTSPHLPPSYNHQHRQFTEKQTGHGHRPKNKPQRLPKDFIESSALYKLSVSVYVLLKVNELSNFPETS